MTNAVVFDFNGTLSTTSRSCCGSTELFAEHGRPLSAQEYYDELAGLSEEEIVGRWLGRDHPDVDAVIADRIDALPRGRRRRVDDPRAMREAVGYAAERVPVAICSARRGEIEPVVAAAGLAPLPAARSSPPTTSTHGKPAPGGLPARARAARRRRWRPPSSSRTPRPASPRRRPPASARASRSPARSAPSGWRGRRARRADRRRTAGARLPDARDRAPRRLGGAAREHAARLRAGDRARRRLRRVRRPRRPRRAARRHPRCTAGTAPPAVARRRCSTSAAAGSA